MAIGAVTVPGGATTAGEMTVTPVPPQFGGSGGGGTLAPVTLTGSAYTAQNAPCIEDAHLYDFTSTALTGLAFTLPGAVTPGYRAALVFRTQVDVPRLRFSQPDGLWLEGRDCTDGILLPEANTHYRIDLAYIRPRASTLAGRPDWLARGVVTGASFGGSFALPANDSADIDGVLTLAGAWYASTSPARPNVYGQATILSRGWQGSPEIDCSTFVAMVYRGITLENSRYASPGSSRPGRVQWANGMPRTAAGQAKWCVENGWNFDPGEHFEALRGGDILYLARGAASRHSAWGTRYGHISHVMLADKNLELVSGVGWEPGTISVSTGKNLGSAATRARTPVAVPLPVLPYPDGLLLCLPGPFVFVSTHFYSSPDENSWITGNGQMGFPYMGRRGKAWCPVPRGAAYFRAAIGKRRPDGTYLEITPGDYPAAVLSYGRPAIYEVTTGSGDRAPFFHRGMSKRNFDGLRVCVRPPLSGGS